MKVAVVFVVACLAFCFAQNLEVFSDRDYVPEGWVKGDRASPENELVVRLFLKQRNLEELKKFFYKVSDPHSPMYGKFMDHKDLNAMVAPPQEQIEKVIDWLKAGNVAAEKINNYQDSLKIYTTVGVIEELFNTEMYDYTLVAGRRTRTVSRQWGQSFVPSEIKEIVEMVTGIDTFPAFRKARSPRVRPADVDASVGYVIPEVIRKVYNLPATVTTNAKSSVGLIEFEDDNSFNKADLKYFEKEMAVASTKVTHIVGPYNGETPDAESTLDVQYATAIADNSTVWFWTTAGWMLDFAQDFNAAKEVPLVISMSWGWTSQDQCQITNCNGLSSKQYIDRVDTEWQKMGSRGVSVFAASGDQGAPGDGNPYCSNPSAPLSSIYPGASPYVTSVGATMLVAASSNNVSAAAEPPICKVYQCATSTKEAVCTYPTALITSGGGFAYYDARPSWQDKQVSAYLDSGVALPPTKYFNKANRGFPDTAALGHNYLIRLGGSWEIVDGTSCSSPVWAAIATLLNDARLNAGKSPLGFVAPLLYTIFESDPSAFNSMPTGNNKCTESCCSQYGYVAGPKWDPDTGLGSPDFTKIKGHALKY